MSAPFQTEVGGPVHGRLDVATLIGISRDRKPSPADRKPPAPRPRVRSRAAIREKQKLEDTSRKTRRSKDDSKRKQ